MAKKNKNKKSKKIIETSYQGDKPEEEKYNKPAILLLILFIGISPGLLNLSFVAEQNFDLNYYYVEVSSLTRYLANFEYPSINPDLHFGFFNAYYPLAYFVPSILTLVTGNIFLAHGLSRVLVSLFSALFFYAVCRYEKIDSKSSVILTFLFVYSIYFLALLKGNISWAGAFIFTPIALYSIYKVFYGEKKFEIALILSVAALALISVATFIDIIYFFIIYLFILIFSGKNLQNVLKGVSNLFYPFLFIIGLSFFYLFFIGTTGTEMAFDKLLLTPTFAAKPEMFGKTGIDFISLFYVTERNWTTIGIVPFILFFSSFYLRRHFPKISDFDKYLFLMLFLSIFVSVFPMLFAYLPELGNTEFGFRALVIGVFSLLLLCRHTVHYLTKKWPYFVVFGIIVLGTFLQIYFTPEAVYKNPKLSYSDDMKDFYSIIQKEKGIVRVNYYVNLYYPLCDNCIEFGANHNRFAITRDEQTTNLWGYVDFAQRNPADPNISGFLGEKYLIITKELSPKYIEKGYIIDKEGEELTLLENPNSTSIFQFVSENISTDLIVYREGSKFKTDFETKNDGILLIKFAYHPLAEVFDNGKEAEIKETNYGIMYIELKKGSHEIVFHYNTYKYYYVTLLSLGALLFYYRRNIINLKTYIRI